MLGAMVVSSACAATWARLAAISSCAGLSAGWDSRRRSRSTAGTASCRSTGIATSEGRARSLLAVPAGNRHRPSGAHGFADLGIGRQVEPAAIAARVSMSARMRPSASPGSVITKEHCASDEGPAQPANEGDDHLVRLEHRPRFGNEIAQRFPDLVFVRRAPGRLPVANAGVDAGAELGKVDRRGQRVVGAEGQRGSRRVGIGGGEDDEPRRLGSRRLEQPRQPVVIGVREGDQDGVGRLERMGADIFSELEAGPGQRTLESRRTGGGVSRETDSAPGDRLQLRAVAHTSARWQCISR